MELPPLRIRIARIRTRRRIRRSFAQIAVEGFRRSFKSLSFDRAASPGCRVFEVLDMNLSLVVLNAGKAAGQVVPIPAPEFVVGRDAQCNLRPASILISKKHCAIVTRGEEVFVRDFDSTNGTFINDRPVRGEAPLKNDDVLKIGPLSFRVAIAQPAGTRAPVTDVPPPTPASAKETVAPSRTRAEQHDDDAADLLLAMDTGDTAHGDAPHIPDGSTIMDVLPGLLETKPEAGSRTPAGGMPTKKQPPAKLADSAQEAAAAIFAKLKQRR
jgi:predicted component of type VI protein secretion system